MYYRKRKRENEERNESDVHISLITAQNMKKKSFWEV